ncbi:sensor domain-containing diguanylate cyclase [Sulfurimonas sp. C5]|uniref:sensor domain-containing diguanylate cyclase n=1 Tax=Sulfurimonas sp. C5 TaxID=3036947 RepID=UPI002456D72C|nr:sensor domain-containing diguanylate cyclase [Sulfurimonas sp. C5]MDH4944414.1 sensor domain-containing diguanylate cyclase [Sulfurimonas sp. C5]
MENTATRIISKTANTPFIPENNDDTLPAEFLQRIVKRLEEKFVFYSHDLNSNKLLYLSGAVEHIFGISRQQVFDSYWIKYINWSDESITTCFEFFKTLQEKKVKHNYMEIDFTHPDGSQRYISVHSYIDVNQEGIPVIEGIIEEITDRKLLEKEMNYLATHDSLTCLCNRKTIESRLEKDLLEAKRYNHPISCILLDVDHFKNINDRHGHCAGDFVLQEFSKILNITVRETDYVARYGGEEFLIVLPFTENTEAEILAQRLLASIVKDPIAVDETTRLFITASLGVASYPKDADSMEALISAADSAMYDAKNSGRNKVVLYENN